jgi:hypothetical protein
MLKVALAPGKKKCIGQLGFAVRSTEVIAKFSSAIYSKR